MTGEPDLLAAVVEAADTMRAQRTPPRGVLVVPQWIVDRYGADTVQAEADTAARRYGFPEGADVRVATP